jgi:hypothetical protein
MAFSLKLFAVIKCLIAALFILNSQQTSYLLYLNNPETITKSGVLHDKKYTQNTKVRYFVHYKNGTDKTQKFYMNSDLKVKSLKKSFNSNFLPERAGAKSIKNFFTAKSQYAPLAIYCKLDPEDTISGIIEGEFQQNDRVVCRLGVEDNPINYLDVLQANYKLHKNLDLYMNIQSSVNIGEKIDGTVLGQYGSDIKLYVNPMKSGIMKMSFSPRGGDGLLVFSHRGKITMTKFVSVKEESDVFSIKVEKNVPEVFTFIPIGGLNYPIRINYNLYDFNDKNIA